MIVTDIQKVRSIANYQFGKNAGSILFDNNVKLVKSPSTGRIRYIYDELGNLIASIRSYDGLLALALEGGRRLLKIFPYPKLRVVVTDIARDYVLSGKDVLSRFVVDADEHIRPSQEVIVVDKFDNLLAVGKSILTGYEMKCFKSGIAAKVRHYQSSLKS
ncbi:MAG: PUA domain-containing protein [Candidatus Methanomethylicia archaeon]